MSRFLSGYLPGWLVPGLVVCACVGAALSWWAVLQPAQARVEQLRVRDAGLHRALRSKGTAQARPQLALPPETTFPDALGTLAMAAQEAGLAFDEGSYQVARLAQGRVARYEIMLPLAATYPQLRAFLDSAASAIPTLSVDNVQLQRHKADEPALDARVRLAILMEARP
jgi:Tfp pilus assembly protein PilO